MLFYLYVIHFDDFFYYIGKRKCPEKYNPWNDPYTGSPKTNKYKWKTNNFTKVVIECFDTDEKVSKAETDLLIELDWKNDPYCLNECCGGKFSYEANRRGALTKNKLPVKQSTRDKVSKKFKSLWANPNWNKREQILSMLKENQQKATKASNAPEVLKKKIKTFKERGHQQGEKNSQYGTMLIHNLDLRQTKRIKKTEKIPEGWKIGAIYDFDLYFEKQKQKEIEKEYISKKKNDLKNQKEIFYNNWYEIYKNNDFKTFCKLTGYSKSQQNLCAKFKKFVLDYSPKCTNGKSSVFTPLDKSLDSMVK